MTHVISNKTLPFLTEWNQPESERFDISLVNSQALTEIKFGSADQERFQTIYQLRPRRRNRTFRLTNAAIKFTNESNCFRRNAHLFNVPLSLKHTPQIIHLQKR